MMCRFAVITLGLLLFCSSAGISGCNDPRADSGQGADDWAPRIGQDCTVILKEQLSGQRGGFAEELRGRLARRSPEWTVLAVTEPDAEMGEIWIKNAHVAIVAFTRPAERK